MTTTDCLPDFRSFQAPLAVDLTPLTTGTASKSAPDGVLCPNQSNDPAHVGAFGLPNARTIKESGMPAGNLGDLASHGSHLGSVFCIPSTGNVAVDAVSDIPGPGAIGLNVNAQLLP